MIKVILEGKHKNEEKGKSYVIDSFTSSCVLIKQGNSNILVDCGSCFYEDELKEKLKKEGLNAMDIDYLILTHFHFDHTGNMHLFKNAEVYAPNCILDMKSGSCEIYSDIRSMSEVEGIRLIDTRGHCDAHMSVIYEFNGKSYVIAGDAFRNPDLNYKGKVAAFDLELYEKSLEKIMDAADIIIPGHGEKFINKR